MCLGVLQWLSMWFSAKTTFYGVLELLDLSPSFLVVSICQRNCFGVLVFADLVDWPSGGFNQGSWYFGVLVFSDLLDWPSGGFYKRSQYFGVFVFSDLVDFVCSWFSAITDCQFLIFGHMRFLGTGVNQNFRSINPHKSSTKLVVTSHNPNRSALWRIRFIIYQFSHKRKIKIQVKPKCESRLVKIPLQKIFFGGCKPLRRQGHRFLNTQIEETRSLICGSVFFVDIVVKPRTENTDYSV